MMKMQAMTTPNPGSDAGIDQGCLCPVLDNGHGDEELGRTRGFWINGDCPLHGEPAADAGEEREGI